MTRPALAVAALAAAALAACGGGSDGASPATPAAEERSAPPLETVTIRSVPVGDPAFSPGRLTLKPGRYRIVLDNRETGQHNVRIQAARKCCFKGPDVGGTNTTSKIEKISGTAELKAGSYVYLCTTHWREGMTGRLTVKS